MPWIANDQMSSRQVLLTYFLVAGLYTLAAALIWGVNTLFLLDAGLDILEVFLANAAFTVGSVLFEIPTGVLADSSGRRRSFLLSVAILLATTLAYVGVAEWGGGLLAFSVVSVVMGLGFTFYSGAVEAWLVDALTASGYEGQLDRVFARGSMVTSVAMLIGTVSGGLLGMIDLSLPYLVRAVMLALAFGVALLTMHDLGFTPRGVKLADLPAEMRGIVDASISLGWRRRSVRLLMSYSFITWGFMTWGYYAWQPYFLELLGSDAVWVAGVVAALISLSMVAGNVIVEWISRYCAKRTTLLLWAGSVQACAAVGVGIVDSFYGAVGLFVIVAGTLGVASPVKQAYLHQLIPAKQRATVVSFDAMMGSAGGILGQSGLGYVSRVRSIPDAFVLGGLSTLLALPVLMMLRRRGDEADQIVGKCVERSSCMPAGIPAISHVSDG